jgi:hypothetical protein
MTSQRGPGEAGFTAISAIARAKKVNKKPRIGEVFWIFLDAAGLDAGGAEGDRTLDLCIANAALSQLSDRPTRKTVPVWSGTGRA